MPDNCLAKFEELVSISLGPLAVCGLEMAMLCWRVGGFKSKDSSEILSVIYILLLLKLINSLKVSVNSIENLS